MSGPGRREFDGLLETTPVPRRDRSWPTRWCAATVVNSASASLTSSDLPQCRRATSSGIDTRLHVQIIVVADAAATARGLDVNARRAVVPAPARRAWRGIQNHADHGRCSASPARQIQRRRGKAVALVAHEAGGQRGVAPVDVGEEYRNLAGLASRRLIERLRFYRAASWPVRPERALWRSVRRRPVAHLARPARAPGCD